MADALDDIVHAARFQPTHLQQILYDLFPIEGGAPAPRTGSQRSASRGSTGGGVGAHALAHGAAHLAHASRARTRCRSSRSAASPASLKPKSKFPRRWWRCSCSGRAAFGGWKYLGARQTRRGRA